MHVSFSEHSETRTYVRLRGSLRKATYAIFYYLGIVTLWRFLNRKRITFLTFHGVIDPDITSEWVPLRNRASVIEFRTCLTWLSRSYTFIDIDTAVDILKGEKAPISHAIVLTFDDGYLNNFTSALPVMQEFEAPGIFYVATDYVDQIRRYWFDRIDYALQRSNSQDVERGEAVKSHKLKKQRYQLREDYKILRKSLKEGGQNESEFQISIERIASKLERDAGSTIESLVNDPWTAVANWDHLREALRCHLVAIGSHSVKHSRLAHLEEKEIWDEAIQSKMHIEAELKVECRHFAYPNGAYNTKVCRVVRKAGYSSAVTSDPGMNSVGDDLFALKRIYSPGELNKFELLARASGLQLTLSSVLNRLRAIVRMGKLHG